MNEDLRELYELMGEQVVATAPDVPSAPALRAPPVARAAAFAAQPIPMPAPSYALANGSLALDEIPQLRRLFAMQPGAVCSFLSAASGKKVDQSEAQRMIDELEQGLKHPRPLVQAMRATRARQPRRPPPDFEFSGYSTDRYPIDLDDHTFETKGDWFQYAVRGGASAALYHAGLLSLGPFRWHTAYPSKFRYPLDRRRGEDLRIALFGDFANGLYHSRYIADHIANGEFSYAIHVGDVYYAGTNDEVTRYLDEPLRPVINKGIDLFLLAGNHEMYAKGVPWLAYIDRKRAFAQRQEGTYFRLERDGFQIVGIDTAWFGHARYENGTLMQWLRSALEEGRAAGKVNILLSSNEPYAYGDDDPTDLFTDDLGDIANAGLIDLWFWGNTHYAALFNRSDVYRFIGSCIGHGGYPYDREQSGKPSPAVVAWLEDGERFGRWNLRPDMGNNGYCEMTLKANGRVALSYVDWMRTPRYYCELERKPNGTFNFV